MYFPLNFVSLILISFCIGNSAQENSGNAKKSAITANSLQLPTSVVPKSQFIRLQPFYNGQKLTLGYTQITVESTEITSGITLHKAGIFIDEESITVINTISQDSLVVYGTFYDAESEMYTIILDSEALTPGSSYKLAMNFTAPLNSNLIGFYDSYYTNEDNERVEFGVSQFAPIYARWSFPCFDEPALKVNFSVQIQAPENMTSVSNMPIIDSETTDFWRTDTFEDSPLMSTYLVAFMVADFQNMSVTDDNDRIFTVWATSSGISQAGYALSIGPRILKFYESYFQIPYSLPKLDMAAVPDFYYGAMENWGLIIYRETAMLYDSEFSSANDKQGVCTIIAHEEAHQWFGNLVTFKWWNDVWLNEGFASFLEYIGCDDIEPDFGVRDQFLLNELQRAFAIDSLASSNPLSPNITERSQIYNVYNTIAYSKGASIIRMMEYFLTPDTFGQGLSNYLNYFSYSNADHDDLWEALTLQGHQDGTLNQSLTVKEIMDPWTLQSGYPVLNVTKTADGFILLSQKRFLQNANETLENVTWWIPITYVSQANPDFSQTNVSQWMTEQEAVIFDAQLESSPDQWVIFNVQQNGYYRVNYDSDNWNRLIVQFQENHTVINKLNRAQILDDGYSLARIGALDYDVILSINSYLGDESEFVPMKTALDRLEYLYTMLQRSSANTSFTDYMLSLVVPIYNFYGFEDNLSDPHLTQMKRTLIVDWACRLGYEPCTSNSTLLYSQWMAKPSDNVISPNLRPSVYCSAIGQGSEVEWDFAYQRYLTASNANQKDSLIYGMGCTTQERLINRYLNLTFNSESGIRQQDVNDVFRSLAENIYGRDIAWDYIQTNTDFIASYMGNYQAVKTLVEIVTETFNTDENLLEVEQYELSYSSSFGTHSLDQSEEVVQNNIQWMNSYFIVIQLWLQDNGF